MFTDSDLRQLAAKGITPEQASGQLSRFKTGFPDLHIEDSARVGHGILRLPPERRAEARERWRCYLADGGDVCKFVPASGAASRMFKALFAYADGSAAPGPEIAEVIERIHDFAFFPQLNEACIRACGKDADTLIAEGDLRAVISLIISERGLNYGHLPKGLLSFHSYDTGARTPVEEQIAEGAATAVKPGGTLRLHFTVSPAHRAMFERKLAEAIPAAEARYGIHIKAGLSEQKASTDTIAANEDGTPFRQADSSLLFRPGGHGALIENLNDLDATVVFVKNIDNVVPDSHRADTVEWKEILGGELLLVHDRITALLEALRSPSCTDADIERARTFVADTLQTTLPSTTSGGDLRAALIAKLDRPLRVCGMVVNEGEPGGGPYIARNPDGSTSPQILESTQIAEPYKPLMATATHFNPVDLVCYLKRPDGTRYNLPDYVDPATGFISHKSAEGRNLLALELPGLWNGAMSDWNTVFVEVPASTFNPVKTVNDLLRPAHRP